MAANHFDDLRALAESFTLSSWPDMLCPTCKKGALVLTGENSIQLVESAASAAAHDHDDWDPGWISGHFHGAITCNRGGCGDMVLVTGMYWCVEQDSDWSFEAVYKPVYFLPALPLIIPDDRFPSTVVQMVNEASAVLWTDASSAANRVRSAVEELLTLQKVPRFQVTRKHERQRLTLGARITKFNDAKTKHVAAAELLRAIKWIGNEGSHGSSLTAKDVIEAAELLEHALNLIYDKHDRELYRRAALINKKKGVR